MESLPISKVRPNSDNPRYIKDEKFKKLVQSIKEFPEMMPVRPIVVNKEMVVLGGNMRLKAMQEAGLEKVWVEVVDWSEEKQREFIIKDNVGFGEWDWDELANTWEAEELNEWGLDTPDNWGGEELEAEEDDYEVPEELKTDVVFGDLIEIGEHRLLCGDSTDSDQVAKLMNGEKADMVFTDPPYGMFLDTDYSEIKGSKNAKIQGGGKKYGKVIGDHNDFTPELINTIFACFDYCKEIFIWGADYFAELIPDKNEGSWIVWDKRGGEDADKIVGSSFELCWSKQKHKRLIARVKWMGAFGYADARDRVHPTQKPLKLVEFFLNNWGDKTKLIADLFLGSGTTMAAAHQLKRKCYGMELDPKYCQVIIDRMTKLDPTLIVKINGKEYVKTTIEQ
jgi:DNA modification methylase